MSQADKKPEWNYYTHIWKTEAAYLSWIRSHIRKIWKNSPQRVEFLNSKVLKTPKYDAKGDPITFKNGNIKYYKSYKCETCGCICYDVDKAPGSSVRKTYAVDHIKGNHSLVHFDQAPAFFEAMLRVNKEDLQLLCITCHDIKSYSERYGLSLADAKIAKDVIQIVKNKKDKSFFTDRKLPVPSNLQKRKDQMFIILKREN